MISCVELTKQFPVRRRLHSQGHAVDALRGININVARGAIHGLIGPNGSGKSTLLRIMATLLLPSSGSATLDGLEVRSSALDIRRMIGLSTGDDRSLYWRLTGRQNLEFYAGLYRLSKPDRRIAELLLQFDLESAADRPVGGYSQGMLHRLGLARAVLHQPKVLLLDEPTRSLDPLAREEFHNALRTMRDEREITILMATHDLGEAAELCSHVSVLRNGGILKEVLSPNTDTLISALRQEPA